MEILTKHEATQSGLLEYFTGKPCKWGHISPRYTSTSRCIECYTKDTYQWYNQNKSRSAALNKAWQSTNKERIAKRTNTYYKQHKITYTERTKQWRSENPHRVSENNRIRNTRLEQAIPPWFEEDKVRTVYLKRDELNEALGTNFQVDHIIPLNPRNKSVCGLHCWANLQLLEQSLNDSKKDSYPTDW